MTLFVMAAPPNKRLKTDVPYHHEKSEMLAEIAAAQRVVWRLRVKRFAQ
jgi:hypothetical protein